MHAGSERKICNPFSYQRAKTYNFEAGAVDGSDRTALQLIRDTKTVQLVLHKHHSWSVGLSSSKAAQMRRTIASAGHPHALQAFDRMCFRKDLGPPKRQQPYTAQGQPDLWRLEPLPGNFSDEPEMRINLLNISYVNVTHERNNTPSIFEIVYEGGRRDTFIGGIYYPKDLVHSSLLDLCSNATKLDLIANSSGIALEPDDAPADVWKRHAANPGIAGAVAAGAVALPTTAYGVLGVITGCFGWCQLILPAFIGAGFLGASVVGAAAMIVAVAVIAPIAYKQHKLHHELGLTMGEKIVEKLRCHKEFRLCGEGVLAPKRVGCPSAVEA